jgi:ParB family transcriptional regulator, chromosome partitioning protein
LSPKTSKIRRAALGKGLGALIPGAGVERGGSKQNREFFLCPIERIYPQPDQPRQHFDKDELQGLVDSICEQGIIQPAVVRRRDGTDGYEIIAGERRWRAAQLAGLKEIPIVVKDVSPAEAFEMALVENIQREDLNPIEEAEALRRLIDEHNYTQAEVASRIGRNRSTVANSLRLLGLPLEVRKMVVRGDLSEGHARALLQAPEKNITTLARKVVAGSLTVRETERRARSKATPQGNKKAVPAENKSSETKQLVDKLCRTLGARVNILDKKGKGKIEISYTSYEELDGILDRILR